MTPTLPMDYRQYRAALATEVERITGVKCVLEEPTYQNATRPPLPYFSFKITVPGAVFGDDWNTYTGEGTKFGRYGQRRMTVSFHCYAQEQEDAYNLMGVWQANLWFFAVQQRLRAAGMAVWDVGAVADVTELLNTGYEGRSHMDVKFGVVSSLIEDNGEITSVEGTGTIESDSGTVEEPFTAPGTGDE